MVSAADQEPYVNSHLALQGLTYWGQSKMADILQMKIFKFSFLKIAVFWCKFH